MKPGSSFFEYQVKPSGKTYLECKKLVYKKKNFFKDSIDEMKQLCYYNGR